MQFWQKGTNQAHRFAMLVQLEVQRRKLRRQDDSQALGVHTEVMMGHYCNTAGSM